MSETWRSPHRLFLLAFGGLIVVLLLSPVLVVVAISFTPANVLTFPPGGFSTRWYERIVTDPVWSSGFLNSAQVAVLTAVLATTLGTMAALGITRGRFPGKSAVNGLVLVPLVVPTIVMAIGMFTVLAPWKVTGTVAGVVLAHTSLAIPFVAVSVSASLRNLDRNLELAAMNLGAGPIRTFSRITLPLILPGVLTGMLFAFLTSWDEVIVASFLTTARFETLPVIVWQQVNQAVDPTVAAVSTVLLTVTLIGLLAMFAVTRRTRSS
jgi:putative spermidine/putrescine transport system permease protein